MFRSDPNEIHKLSKEKNTSYRTKIFGLMCWMQEKHEASGSDTKTRNQLRPTVRKLEQILSNAAPVGTKEGLAVNQQQVHEGSLMKVE